MTHFQDWPPAPLPLAVFDEIESGLIVCDGDGTLRFVNLAARQELAANRLLRRDGDRLRRAARAAGEFETALAAAQRGRRTLLRLEAGSDRCRFRPSRRRRCS